MNYLNPIEAEQAVKIANDAYEMALAYEIDSNEMLTMAGDELRAIVGRKKQIEELRMSLTRPLDESKKRIMDLFRSPTDRLEQAESLLRKGITAYQQAERAKQEAARREAEEKQRQEREAQRKLEEAARLEAEAARASGDLEAAEAAEAAQAVAQEAIELADVAPSLPAVESQKVVGISSRQNWKAEVLNLGELVQAAAIAISNGDHTLLALLSINTVALNQIAKALKAQANIPGVRVYAEESLSVRSA
jgi:hypothetical protein